MSYDNQFQDSEDELASINPETLEIAEERLTDPCKLRAIHEKAHTDDLESAANRALVQELMDYVPPFKSQDIQGTERFNVNFGMASAIKNEAVATFVDIWSSPTCLMDVRLKKDIPQEVRLDWETIMSEEASVVLRNWEGGFPRFLSLMDMVVTHGIGISYFDDAKDFRFNVGGLEEFKFPAETEAFSGSAPIITSRRYLDVDVLYRMIEGSKSETKDGWDVQLVKETIARHHKHDFLTDNFEAQQREIKANRVWTATCLDKIELIFGLVREMDGSYSIYATTSNLVNKEGKKYRKSEDIDDKNKEKFIYKQRNIFQSADESLQVFAYGVGSKNRIHTVRGLGYAIYEAGMADNVMRCKALDTAKMQASQIVQPETVEDMREAEILDIGPAMLISPGLKLPNIPIGKGIDNNIIAAINMNHEVVMQHTGGMAADKSFSDPSSRRNQIESAWSIESMTKMQAFAINLFYPQYDKLMRAIVRRLFQVTQNNPELVDIVRDMKRACLTRGVDPTAFEQIDFQRTRSYRLVGNGSRTSRLQIYAQLMQLYSSYDANGQEAVIRDYTKELAGEDLANRYATRPTERKPHEDVAIAKLENQLLLQGATITSTDGENKLVHLETHIEAMSEGIEEVSKMQEGFTSAEDVNMNFVDWILDRVNLFQHIVETMETATVHESLQGKLNQTKQIVQQIGEIMNNGMRYIEKLKRQGVDVEAMRAGQAQPSDPQNPNQGAQPQQQQVPEQIQEKVLMARAKIQLMAQESKAKLALKQQESAAKISINDALAAAKLRAL